MGTPAFARQVLEGLLESGDTRFRVVGVVTAPDRPRGRGLKLTPSEVAVAADRHGVRVLKPENIKTPSFVEQLGEFSPDLLVVAAYGKILPGAVLKAAKVMPMNVHASLLPRHRGAAPVEGAILAGDAVTGVSIIRMTPVMDAGPILLQREIPLQDSDTQETLKKRLAELGARTLLEALDLLARGELTETPQDETLATYTRPVKKSDARIDWNLDAVQIDRMVRAYNPWPVARTDFGGRELLIWRAEPVASASQNAACPGTLLLEGKEVKVVCGSGTLRLLEVQEPGKRRMSAEELFRGRRVASCARLGP